MTEKSKELTDLHQGISVVQVSCLAIGKLAAINLSFDHFGQKCDPISLVHAYGDMDFTFTSFWCQFSC